MIPGFDTLARVGSLLYLPVALLGTGLCLYWSVRLVLALRARDRAAQPAALPYILAGMALTLSSIILKHVSAF